MKLPFLLFPMLLALTSLAQKTPPTNSTSFRFRPRGFHGGGGGGIAVNKVPFGGVNIAGFDFGCKPNEGCHPFSTTDGAKPDIATSGKGASQMAHFVAAGLNTFRLPVAWEYLADTPGALNEERFKTYDLLVQGCLNSGADLCIIDIHNYCRWRDASGVTRIIAYQNGPTADEFASFWGQLASHYANDPRVAFDIMNEPHDLPYPVQTWADVTKTVIDKIRKVGAVSNKIIITGTSYSSAWEFQGDNHEATFGPIMRIVDDDGSNGKLIIGLHQYVDGIGGTTPNCKPNTGLSYQDIFWRVADKLAGRSAFLAEFGGGNNDACVGIVCPILDTINSRSEFLGVTMWAAGGWWPNYELILTPQDNGQDQLLAASCLIPKLGGKR